MMKQPFDYSLYVITDSKPHLLERVELALIGGATCIQYREKKKSFAEMLIEAHLLKKLCHQYQVPLFINDHIHLAKEINADGLHLGQSDATVAEARIHLDHLPIGVSARTVAEAEEAEKNHAVYVGVGAIFPTNSKPDAKLVSWDIAMQIKQHISIPALLIGGISVETASEITIPYDGLCVISAVLAAKNPTIATQEFKKIIEKNRNLSSGY